MKIARPILWMAGSLAPALLALAGLYALAPLDFEEYQPRYFLGLFLALVVWIGCVICFITLLSVIAAAIFDRQSSR